MNSIIIAISTFKGIWLVIAILLSRMVLLLLMSFYLFSQWLRQEHQFYSDIPFLFAIFFLMLFFGKGYDLLHDLTFHFTDHLSFLLILKLRFIIMVGSIAPIYYLSIGMFFFFLSLTDKGDSLKDTQILKNFQRNLFIIVVTGEISLIIILLTVETSSIILPGIVIPSFLIVVLVFYFAYKNQRLSQVRPLILMIAFTCYLISQILRPLFRLIFGETSTYILVAEIIDLIIFFLIFGGLIKPNPNQ